MSKRTVILIITDGWGIGHADPTNPIHLAQPKNINHIKSNYLSASLQASGIAVGLPWNEEGNSEVGHLTIGAGKVLYQHFPKITLAIQSGEFYKNNALLAACDHALKNNSALNLIGIISEGNVHASFDHLLALIELANKKKVSKIKLHLFSDGKDSAPRSIIKLFQRLNQTISRLPNVKIASLSGRYFAMDRDRHWDRTQECYNVLVGKKEPASDITDYINYQYQRDLDDQYLSPTAVGPEANPINKNDALIFFNFREDSIRQIVAPFVLPNFKEFPITPLKNLHIVTLTQYSDKFPVSVAFPPEKITAPLGKVVADAKKLQLRIAETEKYAHVTYFFNGLTDTPFPNEYRILIPSRNVIHHEEHPEMMAPEIADRVIQAIEEGEMDLIVANFANADMIAHTGNFEAAVTAISVLDEQIGKIMTVALQRDAIVLITSDHGNIERMINPQTGVVETKHDTSAVNFYLVGKEFTSKKNASAINYIEKNPAGVLSDIAPTILKLMGIKKPVEMTGESLINRLS